MLSYPHTGHSSTTFTFTLFPFQLTVAVLPHILLAPWPPESVFSYLGLSARPHILTLRLLPQIFSNRYDVLAVLVLPSTSASALFNIIWIARSAHALDRKLR
jgi:hypothetical protein